MPKLHLPKTFTNSIQYQLVANGRLTTRDRVVVSQTEEISVDFSGPIGNSFNDEAIKSKRKLTLSPGETKEFTDDEADFLLGRFGFIELVQEVAEFEGAPKKETPVEVSEEEASDEVPTNYMKLKAYVKEKGITVEKTDKKADLLRKLKELK